MSEETLLLLFFSGFRAWVYVFYLIGFIDLLWVCSVLGGVWQISGRNIKSEVLSLRRFS